LITRYLETFDRINAGTGVAPDLMRHLHARLHLGKAVVLCDNPPIMLALAEKQWRKLSRVLQQRRSFATNAVEILKYTYTITQMQHASFTTDDVRDNAEASVYFARPDELHGLPADCLSVYLTAGVTPEVAARIVSKLPDLALLMDYTGRIRAGKDGLKLRSVLEKSLRQSWDEVELMLATEGIDVTRLADPATSSEAIDDAVDILLDRDVEFLAIAKHFQHQLDMARPLRSTPKAVRDRYEAFIVLAHRVQTFSTGAFSPQFLRTYANDTFFFNDRATAAGMLESFAAMLRRHEQAGRANIVRVMMGWPRSNAQGVL